MPRTHWLKVRLTPDEHTAMVAKATAAGISVSQLMRDHLGRVTVINREDQRALVRQLARIGSNINQLARWVNTYKDATEAFTVLRALRDIHEELREVGRSAGTSTEREA